MPVSEKDQELIERYIQQRLTPEEQSTFNDRMQDADFQEEVENYEEMRTAVQSMRYQQLKSRFTELDKVIHNRETLRAKRSRVLWTTVAVVSAILLFLKFYSEYKTTAAELELTEIKNQVNEKPAPTNSPPSVSPQVPAAEDSAPAKRLTRKPVATNSTKLAPAEAEALFVQHFTPYSLVELPKFGTRRGGKQADEESKPHDFFIWYKNKQYTEALAVLDTVSADSLRLENWKFYQANTLLETGQTDQAIPLFEELLTLDHYSMYLNQSCWYLALAYLRKNDIPQARRYLDLLLEDRNSDYQRTAATALRAKLLKS